MSALDLLSGDAQDFVEKVWASRVHLHHTDPERLVDRLSFDDVDRLLTSAALRTPAVRLAKDGHVLPSSAYTRSGATIAGQALTGLLDARKVIDLFEDGATVVLQGLHRYWPPLAELVAELELELGHPCQANAYLTPPDNQGFAVHSDAHDVFVFQTRGSKLWEVHAAPGEVEQEPREVLLEPGLAMYLPTGTPHAARAQGSVSLHVTIGINQLTWRRLLDDAVRRTLDDLDDLDDLDGPERLDADAHLPAGYLDDPSVLVGGLRGRLARLGAGLAALDPASIAEDHVEQFLRRRTSSLRGAMVDRMELPLLDETSRLRRRSGRPCVLRPAGDQLHVLLGDRRLTVPARVTAAVEAVRTLGELTPADLPLDPQSNLVLCRRLVREGLLEVVR